MFKPKGKVQGLSGESPRQSWAVTELVVIHVPGQLLKAGRTFIFIHIIKKSNARLTSRSFACCKDSALILLDVRLTLRL